MLVPLLFDSFGDAVGDDANVTAPYEFGVRAADPADVHMPCTGLLISGISLDLDFEILCKDIS